MSTFLTTFNTKRGYSPDGQIITVSVDTETGRVLFHDHTRMVAGEIPRPYQGHIKADYVQDWLMNSYDQNEYFDSSEARRLRPQANVEDSDWLAETGPVGVAESAVRSEDVPSYHRLSREQLARLAVPGDEDAIIADALAILSGRMKEPGRLLENPKASRDYLVIQLAEHKAEVFACLFLDNRHRAIEFREMFYGTIDGASVHPRELVRAVIETNAAAVILAHNHPSGVPEPSRADIQLTKRLTEALALIDTRVLDHIIVGGTETISFAERGLI